METNHQELARLNTEIYLLEEKRKNVINQMKFKDEEEIKNLDWTKDCAAFFSIDPMACAGIQKCKIMVSGPNLPSVTSPITVMGEHKLYNMNIVFMKGYNHDWPVFATDNKDLFKLFLKVVKFKSISYSKDDLEVLEAVRDAANIA